MPTGAITGYIDVAQLTLYAFWLFFAGLILYLRREDKREGYPLHSEASTSTKTIIDPMSPSLPRPKTFLLAHGHTVLAPNDKLDEREIRADPLLPWMGAPLEPKGDPMLDGVGPAAWANREDEPERTMDNLPLIAPMHLLEGSYVEPRDPDPRGMKVIAADGKVAGTVSELWIDRSEPQVRYLEVQLAANPEGGGVLLPIHYARVKRWQGQVHVSSILAHQFANVPKVRSRDYVTKLEEDKITAYYSGGKMYATPARMEPIL